MWVWEAGLLGRQLRNVLGRGSPEIQEVEAQRDQTLSSCSQRGLP